MPFRTSCRSCWKTYWLKISRPWSRMNGQRQLEVHYMDTGFPYTVTGSFMDLFEGLSYTHLDFGVGETSQNEVGRTRCLLVLLPSGICCYCFLFMTVAKLWFKGFIFWKKYMSKFDNDTDCLNNLYCSFAFIEGLVHTTRFCLLF